MTRLRRIFTLAGWLLLLLPAVLRAETTAPGEWEIQPLTDQGWAEYNEATRTARATNGVLVRYGGAVLTADQVVVHEATGEVAADGHVRIQQGEQVWASEHILYNFVTHQMEAGQFRTGQTPVFAAGEGLHGDLTNHIYTATNAVLTTDDVAKPAFKVRAKYIKIIPNQKMVAQDAVLYAGNVPLFYFPYYSRNIGPHANNFNFTPGYRTLFGPFLLGSYTYYVNDQLDGTLHADYRERRGPAAGPDFNYHFGPWGDGTFKYYYTYDKNPDLDNLGVPIPNNRQRVYFSYQANPATNLYLKSLVRYESDPAVVRDFFEGEYRKDPQPSTFFEANKFWDNFNLDLYVQPRLNEFLETVERLPDVRLTGYRQQLGESPLYYESETSAGYYRRLFAVGAPTNTPPSLFPGTNYSAGRADTYHQVVLPQTYFGWLNVTPRLGGRFTSYSEASGPGATTEQENRGVLNTGAEVSFKASRLWPEVQNDLFEVDGLRHIVEPSANYVFVPNPTVPPRELPQFDYQLPSLRLLPIEYPDYNAIDSIDSQNVIRWGLHNKIQTRRDGQVANLVDWNLYTDWRLKPRPDQSTFADLYSDLTIKPRSWLGLESLTRYDLETGRFRLAFHSINIQPNNVWSWGIGNYYLRDDPELGSGNNVLTSTMYLRLNENWGLRAGHYFDVQAGRLREQAYSVYRDLRSWTAALSFLVRETTPDQYDYGVAFTFSLKAYPRYGLGADAVTPYGLLGR